MEQGWDPDVKKFFIRVLNSISMGLLWMMAMVTAGLYFGLAYPDGKPIIYTILFYVVMVVSLFLLIRYYYKKWKS
jgi:hypothetical protein